MASDHPNTSPSLRSLPVSSRLARSQSERLAALAGSLRLASTRVLGALARRGSSIRAGGFVSISDEPVPNLR